MKPSLKALLIAFVAAVLLHIGSLAGISWQLAQAGSALTKRSDPLLTRSIAPSTPVVKAPAPLAATPPTAPLQQNTKATPPEPRPTPSTPEPTPTQTATPEASPTLVVIAPVEPTGGQATGPFIIINDEITSLPANSSPTTGSDSLGSINPAGNSSVSEWPPDTRLSYKLGGYFRGDLHGSAEVLWSRNQAPKAAHEEYQVRITLKIALLPDSVMTSQGRIIGDSLQPDVFEERRIGGAPRSARMTSPTELKLENGSTLAIPPEARGKLQDTASQFVDLAYRFSVGALKLEAGKSVNVWLARPGGLDLWTYDVSAPETLQLPRLGAVQAFRLIPRPLANPRGNISSEMWFAPSLQYLPVRIKILQGKENTIDLLVEKIEQR